MKNKPIIIVAGEPKSIFFEIFLKALKKNNFKSPLILICCKNLLLQQTRKKQFKRKLKIIEINQLDNNIILNNKTINLIDIKLQKSSNKKIKKNFQKNILMHHLERHLN